MLKRFVPLLAFVAGCHTPDVGAPRTTETRFAPPAPVRVTPGVVQASAVVPGPNSPPVGQAASSRPERVDLPTLWDLALTSNPTLREAAADVEAARGRLLQAGLYPNPRFLYSQDTIGSNIARPGNSVFEFNQEIVTAGKRRLDIAVARRETDGLAVGLVGRKFEVLTRVRRAYYDYLGQRYLLDLNGETVTTLEKGLEITRQQVETAKIRPRTDLLRLEALLAEARINQARAQDTAEGAWRQLAAEVGVPFLPEPTAAGTLPEAVPGWQADDVLKRVLGVNTALQQAAVEVERSRLAVERARAGAVPNVHVGGGFTVDRTDQTGGGLVSVETALPLWDRQQGRVYEAKAKLMSAQAAVQSAETKLAGSTAEAYARYKAASRQVRQLEAEVLPRLRESLDLIRKAYQAGSAAVTFADVLTTEQNLMTTRVTLAEARRGVWVAVADLQGLMQLDVGEEGAVPNIAPSPALPGPPPSKDRP
jgi:cobalt-zinc-cadmium efflux system outer membrane protein